MFAQVVKSKRGKDKLAHDGFMYTFNKRSKDGQQMYWVCERRDCKARIRTSENHRILGYVNDHNHDSDAAKLEIAKAYENMRARAVNTQEITSQVVQNAVQNLSQAAQGQISNHDAMKKTVRRIRNKEAGVPTAPDSLHSLVLPLEYREFTCPGGQDSGPSCDRIMIFGRNQNLDIAVASERLFMDGTFKITPPLFGQVWKCQDGQMVKSRNGHAAPDHLEIYQQPEKSPEIEGCLLRTPDCWKSTSEETEKI